MAIRTGGKPLTQVARPARAERAPVTRPFTLLSLVLASGVLLALPAGVTALVAEPLEAVLWAVFIAIPHFVEVPLFAGRLVATLSPPVLVAVAIVLPAPFGMVVTFLGCTNEREIRRTASLWSSLFNRSQNALSVGAASMVAHAALWDRLGAPTDLLRLGATTAAAYLVLEAVTSLAVAAAIFTSADVSLGTALRRAGTPFPAFALSAGMFAGLAVLIVIAYQEVGPLAVALLGLPMALGYRALRSAKESDDRAEELAARVRALETLNSLSASLLSVRRPAQLVIAGEAALRTAVDTDRVAVALDGAVPPELSVVKVPGHPSAAIGVSHELDPREQAVVEAVAGLLGNALQRLELEDELGQVSRARTALSAQILEEGNRERSRIALYVHDDVLPYFAAAEIQADNVRSALTLGDHVRTDRLAATTRDAINAGISKLRGVLDALQLQVLVPGGLRPALAQALSELRLSSGVDGRLETSEDLPAVPFAVEIMALEVVRGCLANVARHAHAETAMVRLSVDDDVFCVTVTDDGRGFDPSAIPPGHHGLALLRQRVELARGRFRIVSAAGAGARIEVEVPV